MPNIIKDLFPWLKQERKPAASGSLIALSGAVLIGTEDGYTVVITPALARDLVTLLPQIADAAEKNLPRAV